jgi:DNA-binding NarL/FixJ family response regulator
MNITPKEREVLALVQEGLTNEQIANRLEMAEATAKVHVRSLIRATGVENRYKLILYKETPPAN